jgi:hypothetical protein
VDACPVRAISSNVWFHVLCGGMIYLTEQCVFLMRIYWGMESFVQCQADFRNLFHTSKQSQSIILKMVGKLEIEGTPRTRHGGSRHAVTGNMAQDEHQRLLVSTEKSLLRFLQETGMSYWSCQWSARKGRIHPYRVTVVHYLQPPDLQKRVDYYQWLQTFVAQTPRRFGHNAGYISSQNTRLWVAGNPRAIHEESFHLQKVRTWCVLSRTRIISTIFFHTTADSCVYLTFSKKLWISWMTGSWQSLTFEKTDWRVSRITVHYFFGVRTNSEGLCRSLSLEVIPEFFLWVLLEGRVFKMIFALLTTWIEILLAKLLQFLLPRCLQHSRTWSFVLTWISWRRDTNFSILFNPITSTSTKICTIQVSFSSANYYVIYN